MVFARQNIEITTDGPEHLFDYDRAVFMVARHFPNQRGKWTVINKLRRQPVRRRRKALY